MVDIDYMIKNDTKGFFGAFSKTGKNSAEILSNVRQKDRLLNPQKYKGNNKSIINFLKRNGYHNIYGDDEIIKMIKDDDLDDSQIEEVEEEVDIFKLQKDMKKEIENFKKPKIIKNTEKKYYHRINSEAYKFHDLHMQKGHSKREYKTPNCTKYLPSKDFVWKRTLVPPRWDKSSGRLPLFNKDNTKYYLNHEPPLKNIGKIFIDMDKQTMRGDLKTTHDLRIITTKTFISKNKRKKEKKEIKDDNNESVIESEYSTFNKTNPNMFMKYENNSIKGKKKRVQSAVTSSTRPQTGHPKNINTLTSNNSKQINNTSNSIGGRNITLNSKNINNIENLNNSLSEENNDLEINSVSSSEINDSYNQYKSFYQRQIKSKNRPQSKPQNKKYSNKKVNNSTPIKNTKKSRPQTSNNSKINNTNIRNENNNINKIARPKSSGVSNRKLNINKNKTNKIFKTRIKKRIKGPDFDKTISREYYEHLLDHGASLIPFSLPNFKQVRERPLTMVVYERPIYTKNKHAPLAAITPDMYNDIYKYLEYTNNHTRCVPPNFDKMKARPSDDNSPLPVYMKGTVSRGACETVNETSLKMNNFAEGKFLSSYTSFWPKKSFNKIVNLNLLKSDAFLAYLLSNKEDSKNANNYIAKSMKFYHKNYEDLIKEGILSKFDNVTFKTIKPEIKNDYKNLDKFLEKMELKGNNKNIKKSSKNK